MANQEEGKPDRDPMLVIIMLSLILFCISCFIGFYRISNMTGTNIVLPTNLER
ncbi:MAG: hypothetical protein KC777_25560 [Cyanobacteria bacterium HKST-UBA02]|nr:hypothetical protein [Cyanobacteria bacterium HKST-UBA02]